MVDAFVIMSMSATWPMHTFPPSNGWRRASPARHSIWALGADMGGAKRYGQAKASPEQGKGRSFVPAVGVTRRYSSAIRVERTKHLAGTRDSGTWINRSRLLGGGSESIGRNILRAE